MARRARKLPIASAGGEPDFTISETDWQRIEAAYGVQLPERVRAEVAGATKEFIYWETFERTVEPVAKSQQLISAYKKAAEDFQRALLAGNPSAARFRHLVGRHFQDPRLRNTDDCFRSLSGILTSFQSACTIALRELEPPTLTRELVGDLGASPCFKEGEEWALWIQRLTKIADENSLPGGARKDAGNKGRHDKHSAFTLFVWELQTCLPEGCKYPMQSETALAKAIGKARRADASLAKALRKSKR